MTQLILSPWSFIRATDAAGAIYSGATLTYKIAGSSTAQNVYSDREGMTSLGSVLTATSAGRFAQHYLPAGVVVKVEFTYGATTETWDYAVVEPDSATLAASIIASIASASANLASISDALELVLARNAQTGTTYTFVAGDRFKHVTLSNSSAIAVTLPQAGSAGFGDSWFTLAENIGAGVVTITPTTSTINGAATLTLRKGQWALITSDGTNYRALLGGTSPGRQEIWIPAAAMISRTTNGAPNGTAESSTNKVMQLTKDFDATTNEFVQFTWAMPTDWDEGTVSFIAYWTGAAAGDVIWGMQGVALSNDDALDTAFGTAAEVTDTRIASDVCVTSESAAITIAGTPAAGDLCWFQVYRNAASASDTMTGADARLLGVKLILVTDAPNAN